jgi:hypothetical protein
MIVQECHLAQCTVYARQTGYAVANHPGLVRADTEHYHRTGVGPFLGFAEAVLAFNLDVVKTVFEGEPHDLGALRLGRAIGDQPSLTPNSLSRWRVSCASGNIDNSGSAGGAVRQREHAGLGNARRLGNIPGGGNSRS